MEGSRNILHNMELRKMTKGIVVLLILLVFLTQGMLLWAMVGTVRSSRAELLRNQAMQLEASSDAVIRTVASNANLLAYGSITNKFAQSTSLKDRLTAFVHLGITMDAMVMANPSITRVFLTDFDLMFVGGTESESFQIRRALQQKLDATGWPAEQCIVSVSGGAQQALLCVTPSAVCRGGQQLYVVIQFALDADVLAPSYKSNGVDSVVLVDAAGDVMYASTPVRRVRLMRLLEGAETDELSVHIRGADVVALAKLDGTPGWQWVCNAPAGNTIQEVSWFIQFTLATDLVMLVMMTVFVSVVNSGITRPLESIIRFADSVEDKSETKKLEINSRNEIGQIARQINRLLQSVEEGNREKRGAQRRVYELEIAQKQAELSALQSQINPHFLYNTLDCLRSIAMVRDVPEVAEIATSMSDILRYSIKSTRFVRLTEELTCIREYIGIMQIRYRGRFHIAIDIDEQLLDSYIPRMILQPIVENAFFHGLEPSRGETMSMRGYRNNAAMFLEIADNGKGMAQEALRAQQERIGAAHKRDSFPQEARSSIGLCNIAHRICLLFGPEYGLAIDSRPGGGTKVVLKLPVLLHDPSM